MDPKEKNLIKIFKKMETTDIVYLSVVFLLTIATIITFFYSTRFILNNVNKIFSQNKEEEINNLDIERYSLVEKKLNLPVNIINNAVMNIPITKPIIQTTIVPDTTKTILDKKSITISILNNTSKTGVASTLAKALQDAGFSKATTGNATGVYTVTTILIKDTKKDYASFIEDVVKKLYSKAITQTNPESSAFDVTIVISK